MYPSTCKEHGKPKKQKKKKQKKQKPAIVKTMVFPVDMWELDHKEGWTLKNWCFGNVVLGKTLESPLDSREFKLVNPKGNQPWIFIWRTDAETEAPILWPSDVKNQLIGKDFDAGKNWGQEEKGRTEDEMVGRHNWLNGHECEQTLGVGDRQGNLECCSPWGHKESGINEQRKVILGTLEFAVSVRSEHNLRGPQTKQYCCED